MKITVSVQHPIFSRFCWVPLNIEAHSWWGMLLTLFRLTVLRRNSVLRKHWACRSFPQTSSSSAASHSSFLISEIKVQQGIHFLWLCWFLFMHFSISSTEVNRSQTDLSH